MPTEFRLPRLSQATREAVVLHWLKYEGDEVVTGEPLLEVESDKATIEIESPATGTILQILAEPDTTVSVGEVLAIIDAEEEGASLPSVTAAVGPEGGAERQTAASGRSELGVQGTQRVRATPAARKLARELGIELRQVTGTGPGGTVTPHDVRLHAAAGSQPVPEGETDPAEAEIVPLRGVRKRMAERIMQSHRSQAAVTTVAEVDVSAVQALRQREAATYTAFVVKAAALALRDYRLLNASLRDGKILRFKRIHVNVALDTESGLLVPVIRDADKKSLAEVNAEIERLARQGREGTLRPEQMEGGTFTITNSGVLGSLLFTPVINYPQGATLGMGKVEMRPVVLEEEIAVRPMIYLCLSYDHRFIEGATAVRFLQKVKVNLEKPDPCLLTSEGI
jgi:pyruvate/2-oxoglutarate dehydrogenase complex dihydrolipoamide acyltransferase (E2) component